MRNYRCMIFIIGLILLLALPAFALDFADYYPTGQGSSWTYHVSGTNYNGSLFNYYTTEYINGYDIVDYGGGNVYTGYKYFEGSRYYIRSFDSSGLSQIMSVDTINNHFNLYGSLDSSVPNGPRVIVPAQFEIGESYEDRSKMYVYDSNENLLGAIEKTQTVSFLGFENVNVPSGFYNDVLRTSFDEANNEGFSWHFDMYSAEGVGMIKLAMNENNGHGQNFMMVKELTGYAVTPEPVSCALFLLDAGTLAGARRLRRKRTLVY